MIVIPRPSHRSAASRSADTPTISLPQVQPPLAAWLHYWLSAEVRGRGYATGALVAVSDWGFGSGLHRLELGNRVNNPASCRVAAAAGFRAEGIERDKLRYGTERYDVETHARLATDPAPAMARPAMPLSG